MNLLEITFWLLLALVFYTYIGYGVVLLIMVKIKELFIREHLNKEDAYEPYVTMVVASYNEMDIIKEKLKNMFELDYPKEKLQLLFITDGSDDGSPEFLSGQDGINVLHENERGGKIGAINRGMEHVKHPIVIFSDANAMLNRAAVKEIVKHYKNPKVGCVAGEKRINKNDNDGASGAGEGSYWRYESFLKQLDSRLYSAVGAAGELFSIRKDLYEHVEPDTILDDFIISMNIARKGYKVVYEPNAYALESASPSIAEEMKRKVRISAGGIQSVIRLLSLLNIFKYGILSFQYLSHRVLRWTITPMFLLLLVPLNYLLMNESQYHIYDVMFYLQVLFYGLALLGWYLDNKQTRIGMLFVPYYFFFMNACVFMGFIRFIKGEQSVLWEKVNRAS